MAIEYPTPISVETATDIEIQCVSEKTGVDHPMTWVLFSFNIVLLALALFLAVETRQVNNRFRESRYIGFATYNMTILALLFIPLITVQSGFTATAQSTILCVLILMVPALTTLTLFLPKIFYILYPEKAPEYDSSGEHRSSEKRVSHGDQFHYAVNKKLPKSAKQPSAEVGKPGGGSNSPTATPAPAANATSTLSDGEEHQLAILESGLQKMQTGEYDD